MPKIRYQQKRFTPSVTNTIHTANDILLDWQSQGFKLTLRQLYYQFVARGFIPNNMREYKKLGDAVNNGRLAGLIDWNHIEDRTRELDDMPEWSDPADMIETAARQYHKDLWVDQPTRVEAWIEKDALEGIIEKTCRQLDVPFLSCRGYASQSVMWLSGQRLLNYLQDGQNIVILHMGDHDPSGIDMTRDITERLYMFIGSHMAGWDEYDGAIRYDDYAERVQVKRIALSMEQVEEYNPPPNFAKITDSRARDYIERYGDESWELDALEPSVLTELLENHIGDHMDYSRFEAQVEAQETERELLTAASDRWDEVKELLE